MYLVCLSFEVRCCSFLWYFLARNDWWWRGGGVETVFGWKIQQHVGVSETDKVLVYKPLTPWSRLNLASLWRWLTSSPLTLATLHCEAGSMMPGIVQRNYATRVRSFHKYPFSLFIVRTLPIFSRRDHAHRHDGMSETNETFGADRLSKVNSNGSLM